MAQQIPFPSTNAQSVPHQEIGQQANQSTVANVQVVQQQPPRQPGNLTLNPVARALELRDMFNVGYDKIYRKIVCALYPTVFQWIKASSADQQVWRNEGIKKLRDTGFGVKSDTSDTRLLIRLTMPWLNTSNAGKVERLYDEARRQEIDPANIGDLYNLHSPQKLAAQKAKANKTGNQSKGGSQPHSTSDPIAAARTHLESQVLFSIDGYTEQSGIEPVKETTVRAAIVTLNPNGKLVINGFVDNEDAINVLYAKYANENGNVNASVMPAQKTPPRPKTELEDIQDDIAASI